MTAADRLAAALRQFLSVEGLTVTNGIGLESDAPELEAARMECYQALIAHDEAKAAAPPLADALRAAADYLEGSASDTAEPDESFGFATAARRAREALRAAGFAE